MLQRAAILLSKENHGLEKWLTLRGTGCACRGPGLRYQCVHSSSQLSITLVLGGPMSFSCLQGHSMCVISRHICRKTLIHIKLKTNPYKALRKTPYRRKQGEVTVGRWCKEKDGGPFEARTQVLGRSTLGPSCLLSPQALLYTSHLKSELIWHFGFNRQGSHIIHVGLDLPM